MSLSPVGSLGDSGEDLTFLGQLKKLEEEGYDSADDPDYVPPKGWEKMIEMEQCGCGTMMLRPRGRAKSRGTSKARGASKSRAVSKARGRSRAKKNDTGYDSFVAGLEEPRGRSKSRRRKTARGRSASKKAGARKGRSKSRANRSKSRKAPRKSRSPSMKKGRK